MRGYRRLRETGRLGLINEIKRDLEQAPLGDINTSAYIFHDALPVDQAVIRQYAMTRCAGLTFHRSVLASLGSETGPRTFLLPDPWRRVLRKYGIPVSEAASRAAWLGYLVLAWGHGVARIARLLISMRPRRDAQGLAAAAYFDMLAPLNLPARSGRSCDILSWYSSWCGRAGDVSWLAHGVRGAADTETNGLPVKSVSSPLPAFADGRQAATFAAWGLCAAVRSLWDLVLGRWWHALLLSEAAKAAACDVVGSGTLAREYWFHNSGHLYRPLWTYVAQRKGSRIALYCYSTNFRVFKASSSNSVQSGNWSLMTWPRYLAWDADQKSFFEQAIGRSGEIDVVGEIFFSDSGASLPVVAGRSVAVFDVQPVRAAHYQALGQALEYYVPATCNAFLADVEYASREAELSMLWKRKRNIGKLAHPEYMRATRQLTDQSETVVAVDPEIAAHRLIERADLVVSMPFTSTALIAREMKKASCYYDPAGLVAKDDPGSHGIEIVSGRQSLIDWMRKNTKSGSVR